jgi:hypothetical protein
MVRDRKELCKSLLTSKSVPWHIRNMDTVLLLIPAVGLSFAAAVWLGAHLYAAHRRKVQRTREARMWRALRLGMLGAIHG